jgi:hypothetical protein
MKEANKDIRRMAKAEGIPLWRIASALSISEPTLTRKLRFELPNIEKEKIRSTIMELVKAGENQ